MNIKEKLDKLDISKTDLSNFLGVEEDLITKWEIGKVKPSPAKLKEIDTLPIKIPFKNNGENNFKFIDLFAGIGGIRMPFQNNGGECVFTSEWDKFSQKTYFANYGEFPSGDITKIDAKDIPDHDVLLAGFPCQSFSRAGLQKGFSDTRGTMFFEIQRILYEKRPKAFLLENVKQLVGHDGGNTLKTILKILTGNFTDDDIKALPEGYDKLVLENKLNYNVGYCVLSAKNFGVAQNRERVYIIGFDKSVKHEIITNIPEYICNNLKNVRGQTSMGDVLEDNSSVDPKYTISDKLWAGHQRRLSEHKTKGNGFGYSLFNTSSPYCNTISARYYKDGSEVLIDQTDIGRNPRKLTPLECSRLQGFPDNFYLGAVSDAQMYKQFGNSVSVPVINAIATEMVKFI